MRDFYGFVEHGVPYVTCAEGHFHVPIYGRVFIRDPLTLKLLPEGAVGLPQMLTAYNRAQPNISVLATDYAALHAELPVRAAGLDAVAARPRRRAQAPGLRADGVRTAARTRRLSTGEQPMQIYRFGELIEIDTFSAADMEAVLDDAHARKAALQELPLDQILDLLHKVGRAWADPDYSYRRQAVEVLPDMIRFSGPMIEQGILTLVDLLTRDNMETRLDCDLGSAGYLDDWVYHPRFGGHMMAQPHGVVAHVSAGNVFVGGVDTLIQGIVTKNVGLMKMASIDPLFPVLFARSLRDHDDVGIVSGSLALLGWKGGDAAVEIGAEAALRRHRGVWRRRHRAQLSPGSRAAYQADRIRPEILVRADRRRRAEAARTSPR